MPYNQNAGVFQRDKYSKWSGREEWKRPAIQFQRPTRDDVRVEFNGEGRKKKNAVLHPISGG